MLALLIKWHVCILWYFYFRWVQLIGDWLKEVSDPRYILVSRAIRGLICGLALQKGFSFHLWRGNGNTF